MEKEGKVCRGLFILHEGVPATIFNSQVLEHVKAMESRGYRIDILSFNTVPKIWKQSVSNLKEIQHAHPGLRIVLKKGVNRYLPFSHLINLILLVCFLFYHRRGYMFVHARANYSAFLSMLVSSFFGFRVIWDCRGDSVDELRDALSRQSFPVRWYGWCVLLPIERLQISCLCRWADAAIFVSRSLWGLYSNRLRMENYAIIPCPVSEDKFFFDIELRDRGRATLGFTPRHRVFLYAGSMVAYQSQTLQMELFRKIFDFKQSLVLYITSDQAAARACFKDFPAERFFIISARFDEMNTYYNAADFAILMRDKKRLNRVASPTKMGEYCLAGLPVIMNDTVDQAVENARGLGNYLDERSAFVRFSVHQRWEVAAKARTLYSRMVLNTGYCNLYKALING